VAGESYPDDLRYHPEHDWARIDPPSGGQAASEATFGITWFAQDKLGELVFVDLPAVGAEVTANQAYTEIDSTKATSDVFAPLSGEVTDVNNALSEAPETINADPYGDGWIVKVRLSDPSEIDTLLDVDAYRSLVRGSE
jgi:glycine cleavage system H protein